MPLHFGKRRRWPPSRPVQYILAFLALGLAIVVLIAWLIIGYHQDNPKPDTPNEPSSSQELEMVTDTSRCLVILDIEGAPRFLLLHTDPVKPQITVVNIPANLKADDSLLSATLVKNGSPRVVQAVSKALDLPLTHYITLAADGLEGFVNQFENGITYTLPENIQYTDESGATIRLDAGEHTLSGGQVKEILKYRNWKNKENQNTVVVELLCALINQNMTDSFPLKAYFGLLSNYAVTDLRIDNFNAYRSALSQIAQGNDGSVCRAVQLEGTTTDGGFLPDVHALQEESDLYR